MTPGLFLDSGELIPADELNRRIDMTRITDRELQSLRNTGNVSEDAADEIIELRQRIAELEAQNTQLTASLETASAACIVLKQQQREGWAQQPIASGQEPVMPPSRGQSHVLFEDGYAEGWAKCADQMKAHSAPAQQPLSDAEQRELVKECGLDWEKGSIPLFAGDTTNRYAVLIEAVERKHNIKEKP